MFQFCSSHLLTTPSLENSYLKVVLRSYQALFFARHLSFIHLLKNVLNTFIFLA